MTPVAFPLICSCGKQLQGCDIAGPCPSCGRSIAEMVKTALRWLGVNPDDMTIVVDLPCGQCGYNLRALPVTSACPECGSAIRLSLRADDLRLADLTWLRGVHRGILILATSISLHLLIAFVFLVFIWRVPDRQSALAIAINGSCGLGLFTTMTWLWGVMRITESKRCGTGYSSWATAARLSGFLCAPGLIAARACWFIGDTDPPTLIDGPSIMAIKGIIALCVIAGMCSLLMVISQLARRMNSRRLARWGVALAGLFLALALTAEAAGATAPHLWRRAQEQASQAIFATLIQQLNPAPSNSAAQPGLSSTSSNQTLASPPRIAAIRAITSRILQVCGSLMLVWYVGFVAFLCQFYVAVSQVVSLRCGQEPAAAPTVTG